MQWRSLSEAANLGFPTMAIHSPMLLGVGIVVFVLGWLLWRWASRHGIDLKGAAIGSAYAAAKSRTIPAMPDQLKRQLDAVAAEKSNVGRAKVVGSSVALYFIAKVVNIVGLVSLLAGAIMIALSILWK